MVKTQKNELIEIVALIDRSGSMESLKKDAEGGFDSYIEQQKKDKNGRVKVSLFDFDTEYRELYSNKNIEDVPPLEINPRGWTALYDALGKTINSLSERLNNTKKKDLPDRVLVIVITDGMENSSKEFTSSVVKKMISDKTEKEKWQFVYLGANQDAFAVSESIGISRDSSAGYKASAGGVKNLFANLSAVTTSYRAGAQNCSFSVEQRESMLSPNE